ncbi:hypothetical protein ACSBR1_014312 [Camellia fascicularis]
MSDHSPLLLMEDERNWGTKAFLDVVKQVWDGSNVSGWVGFIMVMKLRYLKLELKKWNNEVFGNVSYLLKKN